MVQAEVGYYYKKKEIKLMKRKVLIAVGVLSSCLLVSACGKEIVTEQDTENIVAVQETEEVIEEQEQQTEVEDETEIIETEIEIEIEEEETATEENIVETTEIESVAYEDFNVNNVTGYSNYIDEYGSGRKDFRIVICDINSPDTLCDNVHDQTTYRGIALGDSREQVIEKYGEPSSEVVYKNHRWDHDGLEAQYNMNYSYIDERYPEVFFCLSFNMDQNDNVLSVYYEAILMKWYE